MRQAEEIGQAVRRATDLSLVIERLRRVVPHPANGMRLAGAQPQAGDGHEGGHEVRPGRTYLVTGCAGFIGSHLVEALAERGCSVVGVDAYTDNYARGVKERNLAESGLDPDISFTELDLADDPVEPMLAGVDGIFHLAARPGVRASWGPSFATYLHDNLLATQRVFEAAARRHLRVVYASSSSVYGDADAYPLREEGRLLPVSPYGVSKLACEALAAAYARSCGLDAVGLRYFSVYGPRQRPDMAFARVLACLAGNRPFEVLGSGRQSRDFTYVGDVVDATLAAMERAPSGRVYNVGGGCEISLLNALSLCERIIGRPIAVRHRPGAAGDAPRTISSNERAWAELDWRPRVSLRNGLRAQVDATAGLELGPPVAWASAS